LRKDDLLFAWSGNPETSLDAFRWRRGPALLNQHIFRVIPRPAVARDYLYFLFKYIRPTFIRTARDKATSMGHVKVTDLKRLIAKIPPVHEQRAIAHILGNLDEKIELNRQMNMTLGAMAQAIFKSWFVDFDPVRAKAEGHDAGLPRPIADLFPDSFEDSNLGEIPAGWDARQLGTMCDIAIGGDWGEDDPFEGAVQVICLRGVDLEALRKSGYAEAPRRWVKETSAEQRRLDERDVLLAGSGAGPTGRPLWACPKLERLFQLPVIYSNFCKRLRARSAPHAVYLDRWLYSMRESGEIWEYVSGTSVPNLDVKALLNRKVIVVPPEAMIEAYYGFMGPVFERLYSDESRTLAALRDTLLPKLISGELRVKDPTRFLGGVVA